MRKVFRILIIGVAVLGAVYFVGPKASDAMLDPTLPQVNTDLLALEQEIISSEQAVPNLKADNHARIVWADSTKKEKTPYSFVYIHGFGGSEEHTSELQSRENLVCRLLLE